MYTVEPLIKDPPRKGRPPYKGHFQYPQKCIRNTFQPPKRGQPPYKGQNGWSQSVLYSEVPLYIYTNRFNVEKKIPRCLDFWCKHIHVYVSTN